MDAYQSTARRGIAGRRRFRVELGLVVFVTFMLILLLSVRGSSATRVALVIENLNNKGIDTLLASALTNDLGYDVYWLTPDSITLRNSIYFDTTFNAVVWCGNEVTAPSPTSVADTLANSRAGFVSLHSDTWDEINLGVNSNGTNGRTVEASGFVRAINRNHWITRVLQDTLFLWTATSLGIYGLAFPDTMHDITPLIIDKDDADDTSHVHLCVTDSGQTIINTGDGRTTAKGRRVFLGLFSVTSTPRDSCQFFTIFTRAVAWAARDTANSYIAANACFTGRIEIEDAWAESASGTDSLESYGGWGSLYTGYDYNHKVAFMRINSDALWRKISNTDKIVERFAIRTKILSVTNGVEDSLWESTNGIKLLKLKWICGSATGQTNTNFVNWAHRYIAAADTFRWNVGGAFGANSDVVDTVLDSIRQNRGNTAGGTLVTWTIPPQFANRMVGDTTANHGWVWHNYWNNQVGQVNDAEIIYHSSEANAVNDRPVITVRLVSPLGKQNRRRLAIISGGLIGGLH